MVKMVKNGQKWSKMVGNGLKWMETAKMAKMAQKAKMAKMAKDGRKTLKKRSELLKTTETSKKELSMAKKAQNDPLDQKRLNWP